MTDNFIEPNTFDNSTETENPNKNNSVELNSQPKDENVFKFDFKFDRQQDKHKKKLAERIKLLSLFKKSLPDENSVKEIILYPVERAGKSGSQVFYMDLYVKNISYPKRYIAKFQNIKKTEEEYKSAYHAEHGQLCTNVIKFTLKLKKEVEVNLEPEEEAEVNLEPEEKAEVNLEPEEKVEVNLKPEEEVEVNLKPEEDGLGVILYPLVSLPNHQEFRGYFLDLTNNEENCSKALESVLRLVGNLHNEAQESKPFIEDFEWYIHRKTQPLQRIISLSKSKSEFREISKIAQNIIKNYEKIKTELTIKIYPYLVHGDLHARNLMLDRKNPYQTELIDFGWSHYGHPAKDFVLMEATLKYMLLSELLSSFKKEDDKKKQKETSRGDERSKKEEINWCLSVSAFESFEEFLCEKNLDLPDKSEFVAYLKSSNYIDDHHIPALCRVYVSLQTVRKLAKITLSKYLHNHNQEKNISIEKHYFSSLFLITLGLNNFSEMEQYWTFIGLEQVGDHIWKI